MLAMSLGKSAQNPHDIHNHIVSALDTPKQALLEQSESNVATGDVLASTMLETRVGSSS
jgi:hypothetical protein